MSEQFIIKKAVRKAKKLRIGLSAASGFGKTYSALLLAKGLCGGDLSKVCVIDSEKDSASLYADLGPYSTVNLDPPYSPERYIDAISFVESQGFEVCIVDSITHEWEGEGGCLDIHAALGGDFKTWAKVTPRHNDFINKILRSSCHIITTVRRKQDYEMVQVGGRTQIQKVGTKELTRDGFEYELDINFEVINSNHMVKASKDRTQLFINEPEFIITEEIGKQLIQWSNSGSTEALDDAMNQVRNAKEEGDLNRIYLAFKSSIGNHPDFIEALKIKKEQLKTEQKLNN